MGRYDIETEILQPAELPSWRLGGSVMTHVEEFAALIEEAKRLVEVCKGVCSGPEGGIPFWQADEIEEVLRAAIATWEAMEMQESTKSERYSVATMCRHALRYAALSATKEPKP